MGWSVVERFVESKCDTRESEDVIVVTDNFAAVVDGATDETGALFDGRSGGRFAAEAVRNAIELLPSNVTAREFTDELTRSLTLAVHEATGDLAPTTRWPSASLVCLSIFRDEIWRIGDCNFTVDEVAVIGSKRVDDAAYGFRAAVNAALLHAGTPLEEILRDDPGTEAARVLFDLQQQLTNLVGPWGYGCVNGRPVPDEFIEVFPVERDAAAVVLTTDGYPTVEPTVAGRRTTRRDDRTRPRCDRSAVVDGQVSSARIPFDGRPRLPPTRPAVFVPLCP
jgi:hypothetical protein